MSATLTTTSMHQSLALKILFLPSHFLMSWRVEHKMSTNQFNSRTCWRCCFHFSVLRSPPQSSISSARLNVLNLDLRSFYGGRRNFPVIWHSLKFTTEWPRSWRVVDSIQPETTQKKRGKSALTQIETNNLMQCFPITHNIHMISAPLTENVFTIAFFKVGKANREGIIVEDIISVQNCCVQIILLKTLATKHFSELLQTPFRFINNIFLKSDITWHYYLGSILLHERWRMF